jgi:hypothetical protein
MKKRLVERFQLELIGDERKSLFQRSGVMSNHGLRLYKFLRMVVNSELTSLLIPAQDGLSRHFTLAPQRTAKIVGDLWASVSRECPRLQRLEWLKKGAETRHLDLTPNLGDLIQLTELTELVLHEFTVNDQHLAALAAALSKLR